MLIAASPFTEILSQEGIRVSTVQNKAKLLNSLIVLSSSAQGQLQPSKAGVEVPEERLTFGSFHFSFVAVWGVVISN